MRKLAIVIFALCSAACETAAQREMARLDRNTSAKMPELDACESRMTASAEYAALSPKFSLWTGRPTLAQQTDASRPTPDERRMLLEFHQRYLMPCRSINLEIASKTVDALVPVLADFLCATRCGVRRRSEW